MNNKHETPEDLELLQLVKKSHRKRRWQNIFSPLFVLFLTLFLGGFFILNYFNLGPFTGNQTAGIPDNHLRLNPTDISISQLIFDTAATYQLNYTGKNVELWLEYYQDGEKKAEKQLGPIFSTEDAEKKRNFSGSLAYGVNDLSQFDEKEDIFLTYTMLINGASGKEVIHLSEYGFTNRNSLAWSFGVQAPYLSKVAYLRDLHRIKENQEIELFYITDSGVMHSSSERTVQFKNTPNALVIYLKFI